jgi:TolA-binding protein
MQLIRCKAAALLIVLTAGATWIAGSYAQAPPPKLELTEEQRKAEEAFSLADGLYRKGFYDRAVTQFLAFVEQYPQHANAPLALLQAGEAYFAQEKYAEAVPLYQRVMDEYPNSEELDEAAYRIGYCKYHQGDYEGAVAALNELLGKAPDSQHRAAALYWMGESHYELQQYDEAIKVYAESRRAAPEGQFAAWAAYSIGMSQLKLGNPQQAMQSFRLVAEEYGDSPVAAESELRLADALDAAGQKQEALAMYRRVIERGDREFAPQALEGLAWLQFGNEDYAEARKTCDRLIANHPESTYAPSARRCLADCLYREGKYAEAAEGYEAALAGAAQDQAADILLWQGASLEKAGNAEAAAAVYKRLTTDHPNTAAAAKAAVRLAESSVQGNDLDAAESAYQAAAASDDPALEVQGQLGLAWVAYKRGDVAGAIEQYERVARADPAASAGGDAALQAGKIAAAAEQYPKAAELCLLFVEHHPGHEEAPQARYLAGVALAAQEKTGEAIQQLEQATAGEAKHDFTADALRRLAQLYRGAGDNAKADAALARLKKDFPESGAGAELRFEEARRLLEAGKYADARAAFEAALADANDDDLAAECQLGIAAAYSQEGQFEQAAAAYQTVIDKYPQTETAAKAKPGLAWAFLQTGQAEKAKPLYEEIAGAEGRPPDQVAYALFGLGEIAYGAEDYETAIARYAELATKCPQSDLLDEAHYKRAWALVQLKRTDEAIEAFRQCLAASPEAGVAADCHYRIGSGLAEKGDTAGAIEELRRFLTEYKGDPTAPFALLTLGDLYATQGDWANAEAAMKGAPDTGEPAYVAQRALLLGRAANELDRPDEAIGILTKAIEVGKGETAASARFELARAQAATGKHAEAADNFLNIAILHGDSGVAPRALFEAGQAFEKAGATDDAKKAYTSLTNDYPDAQEWVTRAKARLEALGN